MNRNDVNACRTSCETRDCAELWTLRLGLFHAAGADGERQAGSGRLLPVIVQTLCNFSLFITLAMTFQKLSISVFIPKHLSAPNLVLKDVCPP